MKPMTVFLKISELPAAKALAQNGKKMNTIFLTEWLPLLYAGGADGLVQSLLVALLSHLAALLQLGSFAKVAAVLAKACKILVVQYYAPLVFAVTVYFTRSKKNLPETEDASEVANRQTLRLAC